MAAILPFIFDPEKGETAEGVARKRKVAEALAARIGQPRNVGEGLSSIGASIGAILQSRRAKAGEEAGMAELDEPYSAIEKFFTGGGTGTPGASISSTPATGAASGIGFTPPPSAGAGGAVPAGWSAGAPAPAVKSAAAAPQNAVELARAFVDMGYSPAQASGIVGNLIQESNLNPSVIGDAGISHGIAQWNGPRFAALKAFGGDKWMDPKVQAAFIHHELGGSEASAGARLKAATTPQQAAEAFIGYERPQGYQPGRPQGAHGYDNRVNNAARVFASLNADGPPPAAKPFTQVASLDPSIGLPVLPTLPGAPGVSPGVSTVAAAMPPAGGGGPAPPMPVGGAPAGPMAPPARMPIVPPSLPQGVRTVAGAMPSQQPQAAPQAPMAQAPAGGMPTPQAVSPDALKAALTIMKNTFANPQQREMAKSVLQRAMDANDPATQLALKKAYLEVQALENPPPKYDFDPNSGDLLRFDKNGVAVARPGTPKPQEPYTIGNTRFGPDNKPVATVPDKPSYGFQVVPGVGLVATNPANGRAEKIMDVPPGATDLTPEDRTRFKILPETPGYKDAQGVPHVLDGNGTTVNLNTATGDDLFAKLPKDVRDVLFARRTEAADAASLIRITNDGRQILDEGAITGAGAGLKVAAVKWLGSMGFNISQEQANNSQAFKSVMGQAVGKIIKQFGAGTGLSDADRKYAEQIAAGDIEMNEPAIRRIFDMTDRAARKQVEEYAAMRDKVLAGDLSAVLGVDVPPAYVPPAAPAAAPGTAQPPPASAAGRPSPLDGTIGRDASGKATHVLRNGRWEPIDG